MNDSSPQVMSIFCEALERKSAEERAVYLASACRDDTALRDRVEALLQAHEDAGRFIQGHPVSSGQLATIDEPISERPGTVIGPYKLLEQIGEGGFGVVFMAEQQQPIRRKVALKVLKPGMDTKQVVARFEAERQALALMDHRNIAKILDAGQTSSGRPYFVMDLVKGIPVTEYCDQNQVTVKERLELFVHVCQAVQHAHQKGIIHRDLKPSNVLVTLHDGTPLVKIIDFGIAKALGQQLTDKTLFTGFAQLIGTPLYMSPEQAALSNVDVDTRSDIYSLGVLLYELLTGTTPFDKDRLSQAGYDELRRIIREEEPPRPSTRISTLGQAATTVSTNRKSDPKQLSRLFRGELDWIVMKALEKDRDRRYESASAFAADVQRHLDDEPVVACPPGASYRLRKFVRRNKAALVTAFVVVAALLAGTAVATWQALVANGAELAALSAAAAEKDAKETAVAQEAETRAVLDFVQNKIFAAARPQGQEGGLGPDVTLRQAVEAALPFVATSFREQPLIEARLRRTLGLSFWYLGEARMAAEQHQIARTLFSKHLGPDHPDTLSSMNSLAVCYYDLGRYAEALRLCEEALALRKARLGPDHPDTLDSMNSLAGIYAALGRHAESLKLCEETLALRKTKFGPHHPETLGSMNNLAICYADCGRYAEAVKLAEETLALSKASLGPDHPDTLQSMNNLADHYGALGRHAEALKLHQEELALRKARLGPNHPDTLESINNVAVSYHALGRYAEALKLFEETLALRKAKLGPDHPKTLDSMWGVAKSLAKLDRGAEALPLLDDCLARAAGRAVDPRLIPGVMDLRLRHFQKRGDAAGCRATAAMWEQLHRTDADSLYKAACYRAVASSVLPAGAAKEAAAEADRAMTWLKEAVAAGYKDAAHMKKDQDLDALRDRGDFKKLLADLEANNK